MNYMFQEPVLLREPKKAEKPLTIDSRGRIRFTIDGIRVTASRDHNGKSHCHVLRRSKDEFGETEESYTFAREIALANPTIIRRLADAYDLLEDAAV